MFVYLQWLIIALNIIAVSLVSVLITVTLIRDFKGFKESRATKQVSKKVPKDGRDDIKAEPKFDQTISKPVNRTLVENNLSSSQG